jgi:hypothetical protein
MSTRYVPFYGIFVALLILIGLSMFTVSETQYAIRKEFGAIVGTHYRPGLHYKWPWDKVTKFDNRLLTQSYTGENFLTNDGRGLIVDFYIKWKVKDPTLYTTYSLLRTAEEIFGLPLLLKAATVLFGPRICLPSYLKFQPSLICNHRPESMRARSCEASFSA